MGGIQCVTSKTAVAPDQTMERVTSNPKANVIGKYGSVALQTDMLWLYAKSCKLPDTPEWT